jgi:hypothetical protein
VNVKLAFGMVQVDDEDRQIIAAHHWFVRLGQLCRTENYYRRPDGVRRNRTIFLASEIARPAEDEITVFVNGDRFDVRRENLKCVNREDQRLATNLGRGILIDAQDEHFLRSCLWCINDKRYVVRGGSIKLHRLIMKCPNGLVVDHIDGNPLNNRRSNLRVVSHTVNTQNRSGATRRSKTNARGVTLERGRYVAVVKAFRKRYNVGRFDNLEQAANAARIARLDLQPGATK